MKYILILILLTLSGCTNINGLFIEGKIGENYSATFTLGISRDATETREE